MTSRFDQWDFKRGGIVLRKDLLWLATARSVGVNMEGIIPPTAQMVRPAPRVFIVGEKVFGVI
jgi:hypothetical protein